MSVAVARRPVITREALVPLAEKRETPSNTSRKIYVMLPGQGPKPTLVPGNIPAEITEPFEEETKTKICDIPDKTIPELHKEGLISSLHALRILGFIANFRQHYGDVLEDSNVEYIPASVSQYVANVLFHSWSVESMFKVTHFRDKETQKLANRRKRDYGLLAVFNKGILKPDFNVGQLTALELLQTQLDTTYDTNTHKIYKDGVYVASYPSPSTNTLAGPIDRLQRIKAMLDSQRVLGATMVDVVNGAYHSAHMRALEKTMREFIATLETKDPNRSTGRYHSLTSREEVMTTKQVSSDAVDLLYLPVFQVPVLRRLLIQDLTDGLNNLGVIEFGNSRNYSWGEQKGVQTTCFEDLYRWPGILPDNSETQLTTITLGLNPDDYTSVRMKKFENEFLR